jgi:hypothetical protein
MDWADDAALEVTLYPTEAEKFFKGMADAHSMPFVPPTPEIATASNED